MNGSIPINCGELREYVHYISWVQNGIPDHARMVAPLRDLIEKAYEKTGKRTKRSIKSISLSSLGSSEPRDNAFEKIQETLRQQVSLAHRNLDMHICIFTYASDRFWERIVTHCNSLEMDKTVIDQKDQPLAFLSGTFTKFEFGWTTFGKEGFAILQRFTRLDYMLLCEPLTRIYTDHRNLLFVFYRHYSIHPLGVT